MTAFHIKLYQCYQFFQWLLTNLFLFNVYEMKSVRHKNIVVPWLCCFTQCHWMCTGSNLFHLNLIKNISESRHADKATWV